MEDYSRSKYFGMPLNESGDSLSRMQQHYWTTKQAVFRKLGKKEDDCIIASDMELDLKLELFQTIEESFLTLMRVLESYQDKLCALAQEENILGRFLKENGSQDKTKAGKAMCSAGKALSYSAQQRLTLRVPLVRLYQEVETFQYRAIVDTLQTIEKMEKARNSYRGALMWMKDVSQQLDPDTCKQLEKFRKVQSQVRKAKQVFDNLKLDTLQKIDLLSFSRCNLFSQALSSYQAALLSISKKISHTSKSVAVMTKGYQHFEFSMLKELAETSKKLADETSDLKPLPDDKDTIMFFESEYHDEIDNKLSDKEKDSKDQNECAPNKSISSLNGDATLGEKYENGEMVASEANKCEGLVDLEENESHLDGNSSDKSANTSDSKVLESNHILVNSSELQSQLLDGVSSTNDVNNSLCNELSDDENFVSEWKAVFADEPLIPSKSENIEENEKEKNSKPSFLPSQLLSTKSSVYDEGNSVKEKMTEDSKSAQMSKKGKQDMSAWFNLFADLDPLANPDLIGRKKDGHDDRNC